MEVFNFMQSYTSPGNNKINLQTVIEHGKWLLTHRLSELRKTPQLSHSGTSLRQTLGYLFQAWLFLFLFPVSHALHFLTTEPLDFRSHPGKILSGRDLLLGNIFLRGIHILYLEYFPVVIH